MAVGPKGNPQRVRPGRRDGRAAAARGCGAAGVTADGEVGDGEGILGVDFSIRALKFRQNMTSSSMSDGHTFDQA